MHYFLKGCKKYCWTASSEKANFCYLCFFLVQHLPCLRRGRELMTVQALVEAALMEINVKVFSRNKKGSKFNPRKKRAKYQAKQLLNCQLVLKGTAFCFSTFLIFSLAIYRCRGSVYSFSYCFIITLLCQCNSLLRLVTIMRPVYFFPFFDRLALSHGFNSSLHDKS